MNPSPRTCLVTGALGFLGGRIAAGFAANGYEVVGIDRGVAETPAGFTRYASIALPDPGLSEFVRAVRPDVIVHTAGPASVSASIEDPQSDFDGSVGVLFHLLDTVRREAPGARVVALSSAAVYGDPAELPVREDAALAPVSPYGFHKVQCESLLREFACVYGIRTCAVRIFSAYGAGLRRQLLWDVCQKASSGLVELFGTGDETRDFIHADDVARGVRIAVEAPANGHDVFNLASGRESSVREVAERIVARVAPGAPLRFTGAARPGDPLRWRADVSRLRDLGFESCVPLTEGVDEYCRWYMGLRDRT